LLTPSWHDGKDGSFPLAQFLQSKRQGTRSTKSVLTVLKRVREISMEYLIFIGVVAMMALYAAIIVGCSKQPEW
jgi:hypothetical protein